jgi:hypothetical protein
MNNAVDAEYARPSAAELLAAEVDILVYTGNARPDTNYLNDLRGANVCVAFIQETDSARSQEGYQAGVYDALFADGRTSQVGYPTSCAIAYVVSDGNAEDPNYGANNISDYGEGVADTSKRPFFFYGNRYAVDAAVVGAKRNPKAFCLGGWVPSTWGADRGEDLMVQEANLSSPIADTDYDSVYKFYAAWGMPFPPLPGPSKPTVRNDDMHIGVNTHEGWFVVDGGRVCFHFVGAAGAFGVPSDLSGLWTQVPAHAYSDAEVTAAKR